MYLIPSLFLLNKHKQIWLWPSCNNHHPKTLSFRATTDHHNNTNYKHSLMVEPDQAELTTCTTLGSLFTNSSEYYSPSVSTDSDTSVVETIVRGAHSERLFFEPDSTSSILEHVQPSSGTQCTTSENNDNDNDNDNGNDDDNGNDTDVLAYKDSLAVVMETENPYDEFKKSMEETVGLYGLKDWECLEELLGWYLKMNNKDNYEFIVGAFFELLAGICTGDVSCLDLSASSVTTSASSTCSSPVSFPNGN